MCFCDPVGFCDWSGACDSVCEQVGVPWGVRVCVSRGDLCMNISEFVSGIVSNHRGLLSKCLCPFVGVSCCSGCACGDVLIKDV